MIQGCQKVKWSKPNINTLSSLFFEAYPKLYKNNKIWKMLRSSSTTIISQSVSSHLVPNTWQKYFYRNYLSSLSMLTNTRIIYILKLSLNTIYAKIRRLTTQSCRQISGKIIYKMCIDFKRRYLESFSSFSLYHACRGKLVEI